MSDVVKIVGLRELNAALKRANTDLPKQIKVALNEASEDLVTQTKARVPHRSGTAARSYRTAATQRAARVRTGGRRARYVPWLEFGGEGRVKGRPPKRPYIREGRYLYPQLRRMRPQFEKDLLAAIADVVRRSGLGEVS